MQVSDLRLPSRPLPSEGRPSFRGAFEFFLEGEIGSGGFSRVFSAVHIPTQRRYALKRIDLSLLSLSNKPNIERELEAHLRMDSVFIVKLFDFFAESPTVLALVLEFCPGGNLFQRLGGAAMSTGEIRTIFCQVASAISHVHGRGYVLRDLKPENVLLDSQNCVKICDFGWCAPLDDLTFRSSRAGTLAYMSPESLCAQPQDQASDLWSLGVLLFEMFLNKEPFVPIKSVEELGDILPTITRIDARPHLADQLDMFREQLAGIMRGPLSFGTGPQPPPEARALIISLLNFDRRSRPSIEQVLRSPFAREQILHSSPSNPARPQPRRAASAASAPSQPAPQPIARNPQPPQLPASSQPRFFTPQIEVRKSQPFVPNPGRPLRPDASVERPVSRSGPVSSLGSFSNLPD